VKAGSAAGGGAGRLVRVGHRGAPAVSEDNTIASFDAALAIGVDMIEFDVLPAREPPHTLCVAHDYGALDRAAPLTLRAALEHFATPPFAGVRLQLDIKRPGLERAVVEALDASGTRARAFVSTGERTVLPAFRALAPDIRRGWTVPDVPLVADSRLIALTVGRRYLARLAERAAALIRDGAIHAIVPHHRIVDRRLVEAVCGAGGETYPWTVDDRREIARLAALGVTGVITNDPRLFGAIEQTAAE
jgi:glycerophosphoryl diester phosphodiesterase